MLNAARAFRAFIRRALMHQLLLSFLGLPDLFFKTYIFIVSVNMWV